MIVAKCMAWLECPSLTFETGLKAQGRPENCFTSKVGMISWFLDGFGSVKLVQFAL